MAHRTWCDDIVCSMWEHIAGLIIRGMLNDHPRTLRNLQNLPATGSKYAKVIKKMFKAPPGWLFVGLDYASLEDRISALTTKDPNKLKVYMGHTVYEVNINGTCHHIRDDDTINFDGKSYTGEEFYAAFGSL